MTPTLTRTSDTEYILTFPADDRRGETFYTLEFDAFFQSWGVKPELSNRPIDKGHSLLSAVQQLTRYERIIRTNLHKADLEAQAAEAQAYLRSGIPE